MNKKILILVNHDVVIYNFRKELVETLIQQGYEVFVSSPNGERIEALRALGCQVIETTVQRRGKNPFQDLFLLRTYVQLMKKIQPMCVLTYTIKPNIFGAIAASWLKIPCIATITGLGTAVENKSFLQVMTVSMYQFAFRRVAAVFFQNEENQQFFQQKKIARGKHILLAGSGVNLQEFYYAPLDVAKETVDFLFIGRLMKNKGILEFVEAAKTIRSRFAHARFHVIGLVEDPKILAKVKAASQVIQYHGFVKNVKPFLLQSTCVVLPSYHEGMSNTLLEAAAMGRILIATNVAGCREIVDHTENGFLVEKQNVDDLVKKMEQLLLLSNDEKIQMSQAAREKVTQQFDRTIIVNRYIEEINKLGVKKYGVVS